MCSIAICSVWKHCSEPQRSKKKQPSFQKTYDDGWMLNSGFSRWFEQCWNNCCFRTRRLRTQHWDGTRSAEVTCGTVVDVMCSSMPLNSQKPIQHWIVRHYARKQIFSVKSPVRVVTRRRDSAISRLQVAVGWEVFLENRDVLSWWEWSCSQNTKNTTHTPEIPKTAERLDVSGLYEIQEPTTSSRWKYYSTSKQLTLPKSQKHQSCWDWEKRTRR